MEAEQYKCSGCGGPIDASLINFKTRRAKCIWCGKEIIFPKKNSTASPNAVIALEEGVKFFLEKNFESAKTCAETVVSMVPQNLPALFILAYYNAFISTIKSRKSWETLFTEKLQDATMEIEEEEVFKTLLLKTILYSCEYEEEIICKFIEFDDIEEATQFIEQFCPITISKRNNVEWFTTKYKDALCRVTTQTNIPKTWFSLLSSISKNPDSPLMTGEFYLKTKSMNFYKEYLLPIGEILNQIKEEDLKKKFVSAYEKIKLYFESKLKKD